MRGWLAEHAKVDPGTVTVKAVADAAGVSTGGVGRTAAWRAFQAERVRRRTGRVRAVPLTDAMPAALPAGDHAADAELARLVADQERDAAADARPARRERSRRS